MRTDSNQLPTYLTTGLLRRHSIFIVLTRYLAFKYLCTCYWVVVSLLAYLIAIHYADFLYFHPTLFSSCTNPISEGHLRLPNLAPAMPARRSNRKHDFKGVNVLRIFPYSSVFRGSLVAHMSFPRISGD
ncbi:hypothetical protein M426DRAFT_173385 [Hypoxylon sp. CI-4A]|nr:hypothetical protein M426DRAFT_173385 [Hypoxylon sp. CI-4A]